jgi:hypothetical protein
MKHTRSISIWLLTFILLLSACKANMSRSDDGSLTVTTTISQQELQDAINASIADPLITQLTASLESGYVLVTGERQRLNNTSKTDSLSLRLDLGVSNGQLTATISNATLDGVPIEQIRVDHWNQTIASRIVILGKKNPNSSLQSVNISPDAVMMTWIASR